MSEKDFERKRQSLQMEPEIERFVFNIVSRRLLRKGGCTATAVHTDRKYYWLNGCDIKVSECVQNHVSQASISSF